MSSLPQGENSPNVPFKVNGWEVNTFPPQITVSGGYAQTPTTPVQVGAGVAGAIPVSKVTPNDKQNIFYGYVGINSDPSCVLGNDGGAYWDVRGGAQLWVMIHSPMSLNVNLVLDMRVNSGANASTNVDIWINGQAFSCNPTSSQASTDTNWHQQVLSIPANMLQAQGNENIIKLMPDNSGAQIRSVSLQAGSVPTTASYFWERLAGNIATKNTPQSYSTGVSSGVTNTTTEINTFAAEFGIKVSDEVQLELDKVTASLNASFTITKSGENSVALTTETTDNWGVKFEVSNPNESLTYEIWQLVMQYEANKKLVNKKVKLGDAPIFIRTLKSN